MSPHAATVRVYWEAAEARDWSAFAATLAPDVVYESPQTRERVRGVQACVAYNRDYPGDWHLTLERVVADDEAGAASWITAALDGDELTGLSFFTFDEAGRIATVRDFWPEGYEPPQGREHLVERY